MIVSLAERAAHSTDRKDTVLEVLEILHYARNKDSFTLIFPKGQYHFYPDYAVEKHVYITNHDQGGTRRVAFPLEDYHNLTIDGQGSDFIFHGGMIPFLVERCRGVIIKNLTIDWERPMFEQGIVEEIEEEGFIVRLREGIPYKVKEGRLYFSYDGRHEPVWGLHDLDPIRKSHTYQSGDRISWSSFKKLQLEEAGPGRIRIAGRPAHSPNIGNIIAMRFGRRENPGFFVKNSSDLQVRDVAVYHAPGMGLVAQRTADITLCRFDVRLKPGSDRVISATADAVHFTNCRGTIELEECLFENQLDDPCNVHGIYSQVVGLPSKNAILVRLMEPMTKGVEVAEMGDLLCFIQSDSLLPFDTAVVERTTLLNGDVQLLLLTQQVPPSVKVGDMVENLTWNPNLTVRRCITRSNRARGFLITTPGSVLLEQNSISAPGAAIKISGDANSWYESGAVRDVTIRNNLFSNCNYCCPDWGRAVIDIDPEVEQPEVHEPYHRNIRIENNRFETFDNGIVYGHSVGGFFFRNNRIKRTSDYPIHGYMTNTIELMACRHVVIENNETNGEERTVLIGNESYLMD